MIFDFFYDLALHFYIVASLPKLLSNWAKYKNNIWKKLGKGFPTIDKGNQKLVWIHAVSLGETKAIAPLIKKFKELPNPPLIILSTATETGHAEGKKTAADYQIFLPFDLSYIVRPIIKQTKPDLVILTETDFWYHFQSAAKKEGANLVVVNGKISERSYNRLKQFPFLTKKLFAPIDHFYLQGELYQKRFLDLGISPEKLTITGNIKLDTVVEQIDTEAFKQKLALTNEPLLTLGSTHDPEEKIWLEALPQIWNSYPTLKVLLVPRHPERFNTVAALLDAASIPYSRYSENGNFQNSRVLLVDTMGLLRSCYQISTLAFVGGSFTEKVGGHNILEPNFYGKPVLFGPHMHSQPDLLELVRTYHSGLQITPDTLIPTALSLLSNSALLHQIGTAGLTLTSSSRGALTKTFNALLPLLQKNAP